METEEVKMDTSVVTEVVQTTQVTTDTAGGSVYYSSDGAHTSALPTNTVVGGGDSTQHIVTTAAGNQGIKCEESPQVVNVFNWTVVTSEAGTTTDQTIIDLHNVANTAQSLVDTSQPAYMTVDSRPKAQSGDVLVTGDSTVSGNSKMIILPVTDTVKQQSDVAAAPDQQTSKCSTSSDMMIERNDPNIINIVPANERVDSLLEENSRLLETTDPVKLKLRAKLADKQKKTLVSIRKGTTNEPVQLIKEENVTVVEDDDGVEITKPSGDTVVINKKTPQKTPVVKEEKKIIFRQVELLSRDGFHNHRKLIVKFHKIRKLMDLHKERYVRKPPEPQEWSCPCGEDLSWMKKNPLFKGARINRDLRVAEVWCETSPQCHNVIDAYRDVHQVFLKSYKPDKIDETGQEIIDHISYTHPEILDSSFPFAVVGIKRSRCQYAQLKSKDVKRVTTDTVENCNANIVTYIVASWYNTPCSNSDSYDMVQAALQEQSDPILIQNYIVHLPLRCKHVKHEMLFPKIREMDMKRRAEASKIHPSLYDILVEFIKRGMCDVSTIQVVLCRYVADNLMSLGLTSKPAFDNTFFYPTKIQLISLIQEYSCDHGEKLSNKDYYYKVFDNFSSLNRYLRDFYGEQRCLFQCKHNLKQLYEGVLTEKSNTKWQHLSPDLRTISMPFDGCPFMTYSSQTFRCCYGDYIGKNKAKDKHSRDSSNRKYGCPAKAVVLGICKFLNWFESSEASRWELKGKRLGIEIKSLLKNNPGMLRRQNIFVGKFPRPSAHCSHALFADVILPKGFGADGETREPFSVKSLANPFDLQLHPSMYVYAPTSTHVRIELQHNYSEHPLSRHMFDQARLGHGCNIELYWGFDREPVKAHSIVLSMHSPIFQEVENKATPTSPARFYTHLLDEYLLVSLLEFMYTGVFMFNTEDMNIIEKQCEEWQIHSVLKFLHVYKVLNESGVKKETATILEECNDPNLNIENTPLLNDSVKQERMEKEEAEEADDDDSYLDDMDFDLMPPGVSVKGSPFKPKAKKHRFASPSNGNKKKKTMIISQEYHQQNTHERNIIRKAQSHYSGTTFLLKKKMKETGAKRQWVLQLDDGEKVLVTEQTVISRPPGNEQYNEQLGYVQCLPNPPLENQLYMGEMTNYETKDGYLVNTKLLHLPRFYKELATHKGVQAAPTTRTMFCQTDLTKLKEPPPPPPPPPQEHPTPDKPTPHTINVKTEGNYTKNKRSLGTQISTVTEIYENGVYHSNALYAGYGVGLDNTTTIVKDPSRPTLVPVIDGGSVVLKGKPQKAGKLSIAQATDNDLSKIQGVHETLGVGSDLLSKSKYLSDNPPEVSNFSREITKVISDSVSTPSHSKVRAWTVRDDAVLEEDTGDGDEIEDDGGRIDGWTICRDGKRRKLDVVKGIRENELQNREERIQSAMAASVKMMTPRDKVPSDKNPNDKTISDKTLNLRTPEKSVFDKPISSQATPKAPVTSTPKPNNFAISTSKPNTPVNSTPKSNSPKTSSTVTDSPKTSSSSSSDPIGTSVMYMVNDGKIIPVARAGQKRAPAEPDANKPSQEVINMVKSNPSKGPYLINSSGKIIPIVGMGQTVKTAPRPVPKLAVPKANTSQSTPNTSSSTSETLSKASSEPAKPSFLKKIFESSPNEIISPPKMNTSNDGSSSNQEDTRVSQSESQLTKKTTDITSTEQRRVPLDVVVIDKSSDKRQVRTVIKSNEPAVGLVKVKIQSLSGCKNPATESASDKTSDTGLDTKDIVTNPNNVVTKASDTNKDAIEKAGLGVIITNPNKVVTKISDTNKDAIEKAGLGVIITSPNKVVTKVSDTNKDAIDKAGLGVTLDMSDITGEIGSKSVDPDFSWGKMVNTVKVDSTPTEIRESECETSKMNPSELYDMDSIEGISSVDEDSDKTKTIQNDKSETWKSERTKVSNMSRTPTRNKSNESDANEISTSSEKEKSYSSERFTRSAKVTPKSSSPVKILRKATTSSESKTPLRTDSKTPTRKPGRKRKLSDSEDNASVGAEYERPRTRVSLIDCSEELPWIQYFDYSWSELNGYCSSLEQIDNILKLYQEHYLIKYCCCRVRSKFVEPGAYDGGFNKLVWDLPDSKEGKPDIVPFMGSPFVMVGSKDYSCTSGGKDAKRKPVCDAPICIRQIALLHGIKIKDINDTCEKKKAKSIVHKQENPDFKLRYYIRLAHPFDHSHIM